MSISTAWLQNLKFEKLLFSLDVSLFQATGGVIFHDFVPASGTFVKLVSTSNHQWHKPLAICGCLEILHLRFRSVRNMSASESVSEAVISCPPPQKKKKGGVGGERRHLFCSTTSLYVAFSNTFKQRLSKTVKQMNMSYQPLTTETCQV